MKILRVKVGRQNILNGTHYVYPPEYDAQKITVVAYETSNPDNIQAVKDRGGYEYLIGVVRDGDASAFLASSDIAEMTPGGAESAATAWIRATDKINDPARVIEILAKVRNSESLTLEDQKAIDPEDSSVAGVVRGRTFTERLQAASDTILNIESSK